MASDSRCILALISLANILIVILAIIIACLSLAEWNDYVSCAYTIIIAISWTCCICVDNNVIISIYTILMVLDLLLLLANAIYHTVIYAQYSDFCFNNNWDSLEPKWGCNDWRQGDFQRSIGVFVSFYIAFVLRFFNIIGSCLLARNLYNSNQEY